LSKKHIYEWGKMYAKENKIKFCNVKLEHMYGPNEGSEKFTSYIIKSCLNNVPVIKLTPGEQKRDFIYISDVVSAYKTLLESNNLPYFEDLELGSGQAVSIKDFVLTVHKKANSKSKLDFTAIEYRNNEIMHSQADNRKLFQYGWKPLVSLEDGIDEMLKSKIE
uniref:NAD-dependent epimerase/dehydratase family protein n=1 Tax=Endozoicomonas arenosclerae TaxID=1633495 RepID=UPI000AAB944E